MTAAYRDGRIPPRRSTLRREEPSRSWFLFYTPFGGALYRRMDGTLPAPAGGRYAFDGDIGGTPALWLDDRPVTWAPNGRSSLGVPLFHREADLQAGPHRFRFQQIGPWLAGAVLPVLDAARRRAPLIPSTAFLPDLWSQETPHAP